MDKKIIGRTENNWLREQKRKGEKEEAIMSKL